MSDSLESAEAAGLLIYLFTSHRCSGGLGITTMGFKIYIFYFALFFYIISHRPASRPSLSPSLCLCGLRFLWREDSITVR